MRLLLVDGTNVMMRYAHAMSQAADQPNHPVVVNLVPEINRAVEMAIREVAGLAECTHAIVALDSGVDSRRKAMYADYKANRTASTTTWTNRLHSHCAAAGLMTMRWPGEEADDVIATLSARVGKVGSTCAVFSGDGDMLQLASLWCEVWAFGRKDEPRFLPRPMAWITSKYGLQSVAQLPLYKAIVGDASDNLPGVKGMGPKKAQKILQQLLTADDIRRSGQVPLDQFDLMLSLVTLNEQIPFDPINPADCRIRRPT